MTKPKVAILGASGIGFYHTREFHNAGCDVKAILGSTKESSEKTAQKIEKSFGIKPKPYHNLDNLLETENLDAVSICTPPKLHSYQVRRCLESGLHVLCEKPFILDSQCKNYQMAKNLIELARTKNRTISLNTQWISALQSIPKKAYERDIKSFSIYLEPINLTGEDLLTECLPHFNSMLLRLFPNGTPKNITFPENTEDYIQINFDHTRGSEKCKVIYKFRNKKEKPSDFGFAINENEFHRKVGENYTQTLENKNNSYKIEDPLMVSVQRFVSALSGGKPLVTANEILENSKLQDQIIEKYHQYSK